MNFCHLQEIHYFLKLVFMCYLKGIVNGNEYFMTSFIGSSKNNLYQAIYNHKLLSYNRNENPFKKTSILCWYILNDLNIIEKVLTIQILLQTNFVTNINIKRRNHNPQDVSLHCFSIDRTPFDILGTIEYYIITNTSSNSFVTNRQMTFLYGRNDTLRFPPHDLIKRIFVQKPIYEIITPNPSLIVSPEYPVLKQNGSLPPSIYTPLPQ
ncbi:hypothetical protein DLAC_07896 [Tieghemostelium lacteum]|uniref:Uncharacterized protein n=1 Tax=Tieghemostelium lacteum TaxID=361077 RepID=A0A151ZAN3_TIELA|nr:hypothetical protein DLAC_07896 [Tieghemostelium lacteum]|eukprot:KYQ91003.1 hypothetical protein DLAC_07896 [Tieghemostelium lacteum]